MNSDNFSAWVESFNPSHVEATRYWAPEQFFLSLQNPSSVSEILYDTSVVLAIEKVYGGKAQEYKNVACVLHQYADSFKNRINGTMRDTWLSAKTFGSIASMCVDVLDRVEDFSKNGLEEWQKQLREKFREMC